VVAWSVVCTTTVPWGVARASAQAISHDEAWAEALAALALHLPEAEHPAVLGAAQPFAGSRSRPEGWTSSRDLSETSCWGRWPVGLPCRPPAAWDRHFASGMGPGRARFSVAVVDDYGWFGGGSSVACLPVAWDQGQLSAGQPACEARGGAGRCIFSVGHLWAGPGSPGPQGFARRAERSEPLRSRGFWGRLCCPAGKMPLRWFASSRIFEGGPGVRGQRPRGSVAGGMVSRPAARWLVFAGAGRTRRRGRARRRRTGAGRWRTGRAGGRPSGRAIRRARGWRW
jgi:hypothetical protein